LKDEPPEWDNLCTFQCFKTYFDEGTTPTLQDEWLTPAEIVTSDADKRLHVLRQGRKRDWQHASDKDSHYDFIYEPPPPDPLCHPPDPSPISQTREPILALPSPPDPMVQTREPPSSSHRQLPSSWNQQTRDDPAPSNNPTRPTRNRAQNQPLNIGTTQGNSYSTLTSSAFNRGHAEILAGASSLAIPSSFDCPVTSGVSLDLESTASAKAKSPGCSKHPTATNPSAVATLLSVWPACFPVSEFVDGITSVAHQVLDVSSGHWFASGCPLGTFPPLFQSHVAGGHAKILVVASTFAIRPSFDSPESSGASIDPESTERAPATLSSAFEHPQHQLHQPPSAFPQFQLFILL